MYVAFCFFAPNLSYCLDVRQRGAWEFNLGPMWQKSFWRRTTSFMLFVVMKWNQKVGNDTMMGNAIPFSPHQTIVTPLGIFLLFMPLSDLISVCIMLFFQGTKAHLLHSLVIKFIHQKLPHLKPSRILQ